MVENREEGGGGQRLSHFCIISMNSRSILYLVFDLPFSQANTHTHARNLLSVEQAVLWSGETDALAGKCPEKDKRQEERSIEMYIYSSIHSTQRVWGTIK